MAYEIVLTKSAQKKLAKLSKELQILIGNAINNLATNPRPSGCKKLKGNQTDYRIRIGDYRVVYEIHDNKLVVLVLNLGHRKDIYD
jgi:mRNA interferase RelE/StbE